MKAGSSKGREIIRVENLRKSFKTKENVVDALAGISFEAKQAVA